MLDKQEMVTTVYITLVVLVKAFSIAYTWVKDLNKSICATDISQIGLQFLF